MNTLPDELVFHIFSLLGDEDMCNCMLIASRYKRILVASLDDDGVWSGRHPPDPLITFWSAAQRIHYLNSAAWREWDQRMTEFEAQLDAEVAASLAEGTGETTPAEQSSNSTADGGGYHSCSSQ